MSYIATMPTEPDNLLPEEIQERFTGADWSFSKRSRGEGEFHPYPARFIPELPAQAMDLLDVSEGTVLDPFCGSGTTLAVARLRGLNSVGVDLNPIACLISRVRTSKWVAGDNEALALHTELLGAAARKNNTVAREFEAIPRLDHWFGEHAQLALCGAHEYLHSIPIEDPWHDRVAVAISAATVRVSRQDSDTRYAAVDKAGDQGTVALAIQKSLDKTGRWLARNTRHYRQSAVSQVLNRDARDLSPIEDESVSFACFSPPYPNAYEYWLYHKYRMYWLGFDAVAVRESEIGARPHYSKKNGLTEDDFADQMRQVFAELRRVMKMGSRVVVVVGDSVIGGRAVDNGTLISDVGVSTGFITEHAGVRQIATSRSSFNRAHSRGRRSEHILVMRSKP